MAGRATPDAGSHIVNKQAGYSEFSLVGRIASRLWACLRTKDTNFMNSYLRTELFVGCLMLGVFGCAVEAQEGGADPDAVSQAVIGGTAVSLAENTNAALPYGVTVRFQNSKVGLSSGFATCSDTKIGPKRCLTAAHCVDNWNGFSNGKVDISNHPSNAVDGAGSTKHEVAAVFVHPSWAMKGPLGNWSGRPLDVAMLDLKETNSIPALAVAVPEIDSRDITLGWWSRMVGYGSGRKLWGDNVAVTPTGEHPFMDEVAMKLNSFFWAGTPSGEPGDSGGPRSMSSPAVGGSAASSLAQAPTALNRGLFEPKKSSTGSTTRLNPCSQVAPVGI